MRTLKITICITMCVTMCVFLTACAWDGGLRPVGVKVFTPPNQLVYVIGIDSELNLEGGQLLILTRDNHNRPERWQWWALTQMERSRMEGVHDINFHEEGLYTVKFFLPPDFSTFFNVQVVSIETLKYRVGLI